MFSFNCLKKKSVHKVTKDFPLTSKADSHNSVYISSLFRFKGFCITVPLLSLTVAATRKYIYGKKTHRNQISFSYDTRSPSNASNRIPYTSQTSGANDSMMSFKTAIIFCSVSMIFLILWMAYSIGIAEDQFYRYVFYNLTICFYLLFSIVPPLYFFNRLNRFKIALMIVSEMFF